MPRQRRPRIVRTVVAASVALALGSLACTLTTSLDDYAGPALVERADAVAPVEGAVDAGATDGDSSDSGRVDAGPRSAVYEAAVLVDAPLSYYRFQDEGVVARDRMARTDGTFVDGATRVPGLFEDDRAASFTGSSRIDLGDTFGFVGQTIYSVEVWVKPLAPNNGPMCLAAKSTETDAGTVGDGWALYLGGSNETIASRWRSTSMRAATGTKAAVGLWSHVVMTYNGVRLMLYRDGVLVADEAGGGDLATTAAIATLGASRGGKACFLRGALDEVALYDHVLAADRVAAHFAAGRP